MNKLIKGVLLFTALLLPVLTFVFLKMFGKNQFDIPVFNHQEISDEVNCDDVTTPHVVGQLVSGDVIVTTKMVANIYHVLAETIDETEMRGLMKVKDRLEGEEVAFNTIVKLDSMADIKGMSDTYQISGIWKVYEVDELQRNRFIQCELMITGDESIVLVDREGRIRGYYDGKDGEETDRLILESKILLYDDGE